MEIFQWIIIILAIAFLINRFMPVKGINQITSQETNRKFKNKNVQFVDVRTPQEYKANHRKPFTNIPLHELANRIKDLDKHKEIVVICQSGMRSMRAAKILKKNGFEKISNVKGGMSSWM